MTHAAAERSGTALLNRLLPRGAVAVETFAEADESVLFPQEQAQIVHAVAKRRMEYATVRRCARDALSALGVEPVALPKGEKGAPQWPRGIVGSMTHTDGYRASAVAFALQVRSLGIDAERHGPLPEGVLEAVSLPAERARMRTYAAVGGGSGADGSGTGGAGAVQWGRLLFSAKESTYKAWYPLTGRWLGFEDADVTFTVDGGLELGDETPDDDPLEARGAFTSRILVPGGTHTGPPLEAMHGRWMVTDSLVITAVTVV